MLFATVDSMGVGDVPVISFVRDVVRHFRHWSVHGFWVDDPFDM